MISNFAKRRQAEKAALEWAPGWEQREAAIRETRLEKRRALVRFHSAKRKSAKLHRTPPWADMEAIKEIYRRVHVVSYETGIQHVVDHVIPLQGEMVSGLHVAENLAIIPALENSKKRNSYAI